MKNKSIKIKLHYDRRTDSYKAECRTDVKPETIKNAFDSLSYTNGNVIPSKVKHTRIYIVKEKIKAVAHRTGFVFKAVKVACSKDFNKGVNRYAAR